MELLINLALSLWGVLLSLLYKSLTSYRGEPFSFKIAWHENKKALIVTLLGLAVTIPGFSYIPEMGQVISTISGLTLDLTRTDTINLAPLTYGHLLYSLVRNKLKKSQNAEE